MNEKIILADGRAMPYVGMGTWKITDATAVDQAIDAAIEVGYRHFDCAISYENENLVGAALKKALAKYGVTREEIWITSKIPPWMMDYETAKEAVKQSVGDLDCGYLDLCLIHWPTSILGEAGEIGRHETWRGLEEMKEAGLVKSIGVSNFTARHIEQIMSKAKEKPVVNEIEIHPLYQD